MSRRTKWLGSAGEVLALHALEDRGYRIVDTNVRPYGGRRRGEIDMIAWDREFLVFIEVKSRSRVDGSPPVMAVNFRKRQQIIALAEFYIARFRLDDVPVRFDIVEVIHDGTHEPTITVHSAAFDRSDT